MGELDFSDEDGTPIVILCYVQVESIKGYDNFVLISNDTLDDIQADINYHSHISRHVGIVPLRRLHKQPYHYDDTAKRSASEADTTIEKQDSSTDNDTSLLATQATEAVAQGIETQETCECTCTHRIAELLTEVEFLRITGRKPRKSCRDNPKKDKKRLKVSKTYLFRV
jgi:hypothetical protein